MSNSNGETSQGSLKDRNIRTGKTDPLRIESLMAAPGMGRVGMTFCPGKHGWSQSGFEWKRDLDTDLSVIANWGAATVITLIEDHEFRKLRVEKLGEKVLALGMQWYHFPIKDGWVSTGSRVDIARSRSLD